MSKHEVIHMNCPNCKSEQTIDVWRSINVTLDPGAKARLFAGEINRHTCTQCGREGEVTVPLLYVDMERLIGIQYFPFFSVAEDAFLSSFRVDGTLANEVPPAAAFLPADISDHLQHPHVVFDLGELVRYAHFREKLYERSAPEGRAPFT